MVMVFEIVVNVFEIVVKMFDTVVTVFDTVVAVFDTVVALFDTVVAVTDTAVFDTVFATMLETFVVVVVAEDQMSGCIPLCCGGLSSFCEELDPLRFDEPFLLYFLMFLKIED